MHTKEQLKIIAEIARHDLKMIASRDNVARLSKDSDQAKSTAVALEASIESLGASKNEALKRRKLLDEKLQAEKSNLRKWEARAEKIKGEREYTALMSEISSQKRTIGGIEAELNELTTEIKNSDDKIVKASGAHEDNLTRANQAFNEVKELLREEEERLKAGAVAKEALLAQIPATLKNRYERIFANRNQQGIAFLRNEVCLACQRKVPAEIFIKVSKCEVIEQCPSCQRIMVAESIENEA